jgi:uncharacterized protein involved in exopolysaccharide biosynthesis
MSAKGPPTTAAPVAAPDPEIPQHYLHPGLSLMQVLTILRSYWKQTLLIATSVTIITAVYAKFLPKTYTAMATLIVNSDNKDPLAGQEFPVNLLANYVATQMELMQGPAILLPVVDRLKLTQDKEYTAGLRGDANTVREAVEKALSLDVVVDQGRGGQLLYVSASAKDPVKAANIANAITDVYLEEERRRVNDPAGERAQRYSEQLSELRAKVTAAQDAVTEFRQRNGITDLTAANTDIEMQALTNLEQRLLESQNQRRAIESKQSGAQSAGDEVLASLRVQQLKTQLSTEEGELAQLSATFGAHHPKVLELKSQIDQTRAALGTEMQTLSENTSSELSRAKELEQKYIAAVADQRAKVLRLRELQDNSGKLLLELESAQSVYKRALDGYDQIMFASVGNYTNVSVISRATPPVKASKPNKIKLLIMGMMAGLFFGLIAPLGYELLLNRRLRCRDDIEREFGIPVLAQFQDAPALAGAT